MSYQRDVIVQQVSMCAPAVRCYRVSLVQFEDGTREHKSYRVLAIKAVVGIAVSKENSRGPMEPPATLEMAIEENWTIGGSEEYLEYVFEDPEYGLIGSESPLLECSGEIWFTVFCPGDSVVTDHEVIEREAKEHIPDLESKVKSDKLRQERLDKAKSKEGV